MTLFSPQAIVFDLDGTLIDSEPSHKASELETFALLDVPITADVLLPCTGLTLGAMLENMSTLYGKPISVEEFLEVQEPILGAMIGREIQVFPDADRLLDRLHGMPLAIATSSMPWYLERVLNRFADLAVRFQAVVHAGDVRQGKPHPEPFQKACRAVGFEPSVCWAVEDSANGVRSAKDAGCFVFGIDRDHHHHLEAADVVLHSLDDLPEFLG